MIGWLLALALAQEPEEPPTVMAVVAARDLYPGVVIEPADLYAVQLPEALLPPEAILDPGEIVGKRPEERILANAFVTARRLGPTWRTVPVELPEGHRLVPLDRAPGKSKPRASVDLWRQDGPERCLLIADVPVGAVEPIAVVLPEERVAEVLELDARGALIAASPDSQRGEPCSD